MEGGREEEEAEGATEDIKFGGGPGRVWKEEERREEGGGNGGGSGGRH